MSQRDIVLDHMLAYGSITSMEAFQEHKITRISAVIFDLKNKHKINILMTREKINVDGVNKTFGRYTLVKSVAKKSSIGVGA